MITRETIDRIFETARVEEVIADFVTLKKSGSSYKGLSPFQNEKTPSFYVVPSKQIWKDFSSGKGGNVVGFLMEHEHYSYPEALKFLAKKYNIEIEETGQTDEEKQARSEKESLFLVHQFANEYFQRQLWETETGRGIGLSYFKERGFADETIREFQLGYSPDSFEAVLNAAQEAGYQKEYLLKTGLVKEGKGGKVYDRFRGRMMFPILSHTGRVLGFGGRTLEKEAKIAKYLNSPESEIYHKSHTLYGIFQAKSELGKQDECLLVEGYTDVISLWQAGVKNSVASSGTSLTKEQIALIKRFTQNVTLLYDGDPAGIKASLRGIDMMLEEGLNVQVLLFPEGDDPDSFAQKHSTVELQDFIREEKQDFLRFKSALLLKKAAGSPLEKSKAAREIVKSVAAIPDALRRDAYIKECAAVLEMEERILFAELAQIRAKKKDEDFRQEQRDKQREARLETVPKDEPETEEISLESTPFFEQEKALCWLLLNYGSQLYNFSEEEESGESQEVAKKELTLDDIDAMPFETVAEYIVTELETDDLDLQNPVFQEILKAFRASLNESEKVLDAGHFIRSENRAVVNTVADLVTEKHQLHNWKSRKIYLPEDDEFVQDFTVQSVLRYKEKRISEIIGGMRSDLLKNRPENQELVRKMEAVNRLTKLRNEINKELNRVL